MMSKPTAQCVTDVLRQLWKEQFSVFQSLAQKMPFDNDIEALHDFRVTLRQTRALLKICRAFLPNEASGFENAFKQLTTATASVRDLDVQLHNQPTVSRGDLSTIIFALMHQRETAINHLDTQFKKMRFNILIKRWGRFISTLPDTWPPNVTSDTPVAKCIKRLAKKQCAVLLRDGNLINKKSSDRSLHQLRIKVKQLRYLLITFAPYLSKQKKLRKLLKHLQRLQSLLGKHQDAVVGITQLHTMLDSASITSETFTAITDWINDLTTQQRVARKKFPAVYSSVKQDMMQIGWVH